MTSTNGTLKMSSNVWHIGKRIQNSSTHILIHRRDLRIEHTVAQAKWKWNKSISTQWYTYETILSFSHLDALWWSIVHTHSISMSWSRKNVKQKKGFFFSFRGSSSSWVFECSSLLHSRWKLRWTEATIYTQYVRLLQYGWGWATWSSNSVL